MNPKTRLSGALILCLFAAAVSEAADMNFAGTGPQKKEEAQETQKTGRLKRAVDVEFAPIEFPEVPPPKEAPPKGQPRKAEYTVGVSDVLEISILQPDKFTNTVTVSPDGYISFPYIGSVQVKGLTLNEIQTEIQSDLADGYMQYPVVLVTLRESRSRKFFVYGEVTKPGVFPIEENTTVLRAISMAGGFTKFGSSSRVKVLRARKNKPGYELIKIKIKEVMNGDSDADILLENEDIVVVSEGMF